MKLRPHGADAAEKPRVTSLRARNTRATGASNDRHTAASWTHSRLLAVTDEAGEPRSAGKTRAGGATNTNPSCQRHGPASAAYLQARVLKVSHKDDL